MSHDSILINLSKSDEGSFGFSLLGKFGGIPHVIYDVIENSPAAECEVSQVGKPFSNSTFFLCLKARLLFFWCIRLINDLIDTRPHDTAHKAHTISLLRY